MADLPKIFQVINDYIPKLAERWELDKHQNFGDVYTSNNMTLKYSSNLDEVSLAVNNRYTIFSMLNPTKKLYDFGAFDKFLNLELGYDQSIFYENTNGFVEITYGQFLETYPQILDKIMSSHFIDPKLNV